MYNLLLNDFKRLWRDVGEEAVAAFRQVGESGWYILGDSVLQFENSLSQVSEMRHTVSCANGMDAIEIGLRALDIRPGEKVLTTPLSAFASTLAIIRAGGVPIFTDVDQSGLIDLDLCEEAFKNDPGMRFFVPVHLYGHCLDMNRLSRICRSYSVKTVEDCAQSILSKHSGIKCGLAGDCAATSFYPTKNLGALGDGGALLTNNSDIAEIAMKLRNYGQSQKYYHDIVGLNSRLDEMQAAILDKVFLPRLGIWTERRRQIAAKYIEGIRSPFVVVLPNPGVQQSVWHLFPVKIMPDRRASFQSELQAKGIQTAVHYPKLIYKQKAFIEEYPSAESLFFERAEELADSVVSIPIHPYLSDEEVEYGITSVNEWKG